ncbi:MAG: SDR family oxidoreductase [Candidatus Puniceispirillaceae bacterium]
MAAGNPRGNLISPDEIAQTALFLASKGASAINGHALSVSGGEI